MELESSYYDDIEQNLCGELQSCLSKLMNINRADQEECERVEQITDLTIQIDKLISIIRHKGQFVLKTLDKSSLPELPSVSDEIFMKMESENEFQTYANQFTPPFNYRIVDYQNEAPISRSTESTKKSSTLADTNRQNNEEFYENVDVKRIDSQLMREQKRKEQNLNMYGYK